MLGVVQDVWYPSKDFYIAASEATRKAGEATKDNMQTLIEL